MGHCRAAPTAPCRSCMWPCQSHRCAAEALLASTSRVCSQALASLQLCPGHQAPRLIELRQGPAHLGSLVGGAVFGVAVHGQAEGCQAAHIPHARHPDRVVPHKGHDGWGALGQAPPQHKGREQDAGQLLQEQQRLHSRTAAQHPPRQLCGVWAAQRHPSLRPLASAMPLSLLSRSFASPWPRTEQGGSGCRLLPDGIAGWKPLQSQKDSAPQPNSLPDTCPHPPVLGQTHAAAAAAAAGGPHAGRGARLELEELGEVGLHFPRVGPAPPVPGQVVRVSTHLQQGQLRLKGLPWLCDEGPADGQHYAQGCHPPAGVGVSAGCCVAATVWGWGSRQWVYSLAGVCCSWQRCLHGMPAWRCVHALITCTLKPRRKMCPGTYTPHHNNPLQSACYLQHPPIHASLATCCSLPWPHSVSIGSTGDCSCRQVWSSTGRCPYQTKVWEKKRRSRTTSLIMAMKSSQAAKEPATKARHLASSLSTGLGNWAMYLPAALLLAFSLQHVMW